MTPLLCAFALLASDTWILFQDEQRVTMSGSIEQLKDAQRLYPKFGPHFLWFRHGGKTYVVREGKALQQADEFTRTDGETEAREAQLDEADAELEHHQQKLDKHQAALEQWEESRGYDQKKVRQTQAELSKAQEQLTREQEKVSRESEKLGKIQEQKSKEMEKKMAELIAATIKDGSAKEVR